MRQFDWNQMRAFLATAETGSFSAAARSLGRTQPAVSRQVAALEAGLGVTLFQRVGKSLSLTDTGRALLEDARVMGQAAERLELVSSGRSDAPEGRVSISANEVVAVHLLPAIVARLRDIAPGLQVDVICSNAFSDLQRGEADIALRHKRPEEPNLTARLLCEPKAGFYASTKWVAANGMPGLCAGDPKIPMVGFDAPDLMAERLEKWRVASDVIKVVAGSENGNAHWALVQAGLGVGIMMDQIAAATPGIVRVWPELPPIIFPIWLVAHNELHTSMRIRIVFDALADGLSHLGRPIDGPPHQI